MYMKRSHASMTPTCTTITSRKHCFHCLIEFFLSLYTLVFKLLKSHISEFKKLGKRGKFTLL